MTAAYIDTQPHLLEKWSSLNPMGRIGRPDELRGVVTWLASDGVAVRATSTFQIIDLNLFYLIAILLASSWAVDIIRGK